METQYWKASTKSPWWCLFVTDETVHLKNLYVVIHKNLHLHGHNLMWWLDHIRYNGFLSLSLHGAISSGQLCASVHLLHITVMQSTSHSMEHPSLTRTSQKKNPRKLAAAPNSPWSLGFARHSGSRLEVPGSEPPEPHPGPRTPGLFPDPDDTSGTLRRMEGKSWAS